MAPNHPPSTKEPLDFLVDLNSGESKALLDTIDSLRELQVGDIVSLPQIVVVGDQSSGKSSVLEAISRVRFPVDAKLCTRFATELVLRRADETKVAVSIRFADNSDTKPSQPFRRTSFDADSLPSIIDEAKERMGIRKDGWKRFSRDVLRIEISRSDVYPLTLVDLPGIFHAETAEQTLADRETVNQLIDSYVRQDKSIILAVVRANNHLANQEVVEVAKSHDPHKNRTVGVITKPDLAQQEGLTQQYIDLVKGLEPTHKLNLGWFVLRNLSENEKLEGVKFDERDAREERFFQSGNWKSIRQTNRGVQSLRRGLSKVLLEHIKTNLPGLIQDIEGNLNSRKESLRRLGRQKFKTEELRSYLLDISKEFQRLTRDAVEGRYADSFFDLEDDTLKLRAKLRKLNRGFSTVLLKKGATHEIALGDDDGGHSKSEHGAAKRGDSHAEKSDDLPEYLQPYVAYYNAFADPLPITRADFSRELESFAADNQGKELPGTPNSDLAIHLFRKESKPWRGIARFHLELTLKFVKSFVEKVFEHVVGDDRNTLAAILNAYVDPFFDKKRHILETKLDELLRPYAKGYGLPLEAEFSDTLSKATLLRLAGHLAGVLEEAHPEAFGDKPKGGLNRNKVLKSVLAAADFKDSEFGTDHVIDMMMAYYNMSRRTFTENVINLAIENCLVSDLADILTAGMVFKMSEDKLRQIASESEEVIAERSRMQDEVAILEQALYKCRLNKPRATTVLPTSLPSISPRTEQKKQSAKPAATASGPNKVPQAYPTSSLSGGSTASVTSSARTPPGTGFFGGPYSATNNSSSMFSSKASTGSFQNSHLFPTTPFKSSTSPFGSTTIGNTAAASQPEPGRSQFGTSNGKPAVASSPSPLGQTKPPQVLENASETKAVKTTGANSPPKFASQAALHQGKWNYAGQEGVPRAFSTSGIPAHVHTRRIIDGATFHDEAIVHISACETFRRFSPEELRLKYDRDMQR